ncbi:Tcp11-domain-containing protein [Backusella circina FSU 941]|nr:Tcp11-domain-containing protein [Backusella circina FSU 941]
MEKDKQTGFFTVEAVSLGQSSRKPYHLEKRFKRHLNKLTTLEEAEIKREAILEARRQRLEQNYLKVKRIAREMKEKREIKNAFLLKSLETAEVKRNQHIEQRRAASKKSVERAKRIALQNQKRSQMEQERRRAELESRFEETEARRLAHLNKQRLTREVKKKYTTCSAPPSIKKNIASSSEPSLPKKKTSWSVLLHSFRNLGLPSPSVPETWLEFGPLGKLLHQVKVVVVTTKLLNVALKMTDNDSRRRARVLLTSYMTLMCPREVLQNVHGEEEKALHSSAKHMLYLFEKWLNVGGASARLNFVNSWDHYYALFESWKSKDCERLVGNMIAYYIELAALRRTLIKQHDDDEEVGDQLFNQLEEVKRGIKKIGGPSALHTLERTAAKQFDLNSSASNEKRKWSTPRSPDLNQEEKAVPDEMSRLVGDFNNKNMTNDQLAHELIINPDFKLTLPSPANELEKRVRLVAERAFYDKVMEDMKQGNPEALLSVFNDIQQRLLSLVRPSTAMHASIKDAIDIELIKQEIKNNSFDMNKMINYFLDTMADLCAPVRDDEIKDIKQQEQKHKIPMILKLLEVMSLDLANFRLRSLRPHLMNIARDYERDKFKKMLDEGTIQLDNTRQWLTDATHKLLETARQRNPERVKLEKNKPTYDQIFEEAFVSLLSKTEPINENTLPETLGLDAKRMFDYQNEMQAMTIVASLVMLAKNFNNNTNLTHLSDRLFIMLQQEDVNIEQLAAEIEKGDGHRSEMIRGMVNKTLSHTDTIYLLLSRRVASVIKSTIQNKHFVTDAVITSYGLEHVRIKLQELALKISKLVQHHRKVYTEWYSDIIADALMENFKDLKIN